MKNEKKVTTIKNGMNKVKVQTSAAILFAILMAGCATEQGIQNVHDIGAWQNKATQAGCHSKVKEGKSFVVDVPAANSGIGNAMMRMMRKSGVGDIPSAEKGMTELLALPSAGTVLVLSKINDHALDAAENVINRWKGAAPSAMLCVFAEEDRAANLHKLAQEKGFSLHVTPLSTILNNKN